MPEFTHLRSNVFRLIKSERVPTGPEQAEPAPPVVAQVG